MLTIDQINNLEKENEELKKALADVACCDEQHAVCYFIKQFQEENTQLKKVLKDIRAMIDFECECKKGEMCICNVCDKYDAIIAKIDGALKEDADK